jgi:hypothetical protein
MWLGALRRYLAVIVPANLVWEFAQLPLYTIWSQGSAGEIVFATLHCTGGDILIAVSTLLGALLVFGRPHWPAERYGVVAAATVTLGAAYTLFSEWLNVYVRRSWTYSALMPLVPFFGFDIGLSPLLQWIVVPSAAFALTARWVRRKSEAGPQ